MATVTIEPVACRVLIERWQKKLRFVEECEHRRAKLGPEEHIYSELLTPTEYRQIAAALSSDAKDKRIAELEHWLSVWKGNARETYDEDSILDVISGNLRMESWVAGKTLTVMFDAESGARRFAKLRLTNITAQPSRADLKGEPE